MNERELYEFLSNEHCGWVRGVNDITLPLGARVPKWNVKRPTGVRSGNGSKNFVKSGVMWCANKVFSGIIKGVVMLDITINQCRRAVEQGKWICNSPNNSPITEKYNSCKWPWSWCFSGGRPVLQCLVMPFLFLPDLLMIESLFTGLYKLCTLDMQSSGCINEVNAPQPQQLSRTRYYILVCLTP